MPELDGGPPDPQSRDRLYVVFSREGNPAPDLDIRPSSWCPACDADVEAVQAWKRPDRSYGKFRQQYVYRCPRCGEIAWPYAWPAASAVDWSIPCPRIGDRTRPLAPATLRRIEVGLERYGPAIVQKSGHTYERPGSGYFRTWPIDGPIPAQTTEAHHALVVPVHHTSGEGGPSARPTSAPWPAQTGRAEQALVIAMRTNNVAVDAAETPAPTVTTAHGGALTLVVPLRNNGRARDADLEPLPAFAADGQHHALVVKNYGPPEKAGPMSKPITSPFGTVTAVDHHSLVEIPFTVDYHGRGGSNPVSAPIPTQDTRDRHGLVEPAISVEDCGFRMFQPHEIGAAMAFPVDYKVEGNKRERVKLFGNAVTPPAMALLTERGVATLTGAGT